MNTKKDTYTSWANVAPLTHRIKLLSLESALDWRDKLLSLAPDDDNTAEKGEMLSLLESHIHLLESRTAQEKTQ